MATQISKSNVETLIAKGVKDFDTLYRRLYKKGKDTVAPDGFKKAIIGAFGSDPFAPVAPVESSPVAKRPRGRPRKTNPDGSPIVKVKKVRTAPYTSVNGKVSKYQRLADLCINGGGNGKTLAEVAKMAVEQGIVEHEYQAFISLNVLRNPAQFSNRGRSGDDGYGDGKGGKSIVNLRILSVLPTMPDRNGKMPKGTAPVAGNVEATTAPVEGETAPPVEAPVEAPAEATPAE